MMIFILPGVGFKFPIFHNAIIFLSKNLISVMLEKWWYLMMGLRTALIGFSGVTTMVELQFCFSFWVKEFKLKLPENILFR